MTASDRPLRTETPPAGRRRSPRRSLTRADLAASRAARDQLEGRGRAHAPHGDRAELTVRGYYSHENGHENLLGGEIEIPLPIFDRQQGAEADLRRRGRVGAAR